MRRFAIIAIGWSMLSLAASAQEPVAARPESRRDSTSVGDVSPTPEMWFYAQEQKRYEDPKLAVRRNAEYDAAQRQARLNARRWFGLSNLRPVAGTTPMTGDYSPRWTANGYMPDQWSGTTGTATVIVNPYYAAIR